MALAALAATGRHRASPAVQSREPVAVVVQPTYLVPRAVPAGQAEAAPVAPATSLAALAERQTQAAVVVAVVTRASLGVRELSAATAARVLSSSGTRFKGTALWPIS
jgi:hypothetical protein